MFAPLSVHRFFHLGSAGGTSLCSATGSNIDQGIIFPKFVVCRGQGQRLLLQFLLYVFSIYLSWKRGTRGKCSSALDQFVELFITRETHCGRTPKRPRARVGDGFGWENHIQISVATSFSVGTYIGLPPYISFDFISSLKFLLKLQNM